MQRIIRNLPLVLLIAIIALASARLSFGAIDEDYDALLSKGITALEQNDLGAALHDFKAAMRKKPNGVQAHYYIAVTHARANRVNEAEENFKKALEIERTFIPAHFDLGVLYYQVRKDEKALKSFGLVENIDPDRARVYFYQGVILKRNGKEKEGELKLEKAVSLDSALAAEIRFLSAASEFQSGNLNSAKEAFQGVITLASDEGIADLARDFIAQIDAMPKQKKRLLLTLSLGLQYDDNVILESRKSSAAPSGISSKSDVVGILYLRGKYQWFKSSNWSGNLEMSYFLNSHQDKALDNFDIQDSHLATSFARRFGKNELELKYEIQSAQLSGESFLLSQKIGPRFIKLHSKKQITEASYFYGDKDFKDVPLLFPGNSERDVKTHEVTLVHYVRFNDDRSAYFGYSFDKELAGDSVSEDDWSFDGHHVKAGVVLPLWREVVSTLEVNAAQRQFKNNNQLALTTKRRDDDLLFILTLSKSLNQYLDLTAQYLFQDNDSNIPVFAYRRSIAGLILTARY